MASLIRDVPGYCLLDSGEGEKLEKFGSMLIRRPSSLAIWKKRADAKHWARANATFQPGAGWRCAAGKFESWEARIGPVLLELRLQVSGQLGVFPDHAIYLDDLIKCARGLKSRSAGPLQVLNLFAYSGMASVALAQEGCDVCHVDLSKHALTWTKKNQTLSKSGARTDGNLRLICDDALKFVKREQRRSSKYEIVIVDPPSFGRISKNKDWKLEDVIHELLGGCFDLLAEKSAALFFSCHHSALTSEVMANVAADLQPRRGEIRADSLGLKEQNTERVLPAGHLVRWTG